LLLLVAVVVDIQVVEAPAALEQPQGIQYQLVHQSQSQLVQAVPEAIPVDLIMVIQVQILYLEALPLLAAVMAVAFPILVQAPADLVAAVLTVHLTR
jgi:hypothetical protein